MTFQDEDLAGLVQGAAELGVPLGHDQARRLLDFLDCLYLWNRVARLTNVEPRDAVRLHLLDSLSAAPLLFGEQVADLGSGAGLPGIPLALASPGIRFYLVESNRRRCSFLAEAIRSLGLPNAFVLETDVEGLMASGRGFDTVTSRAFRPPSEFLSIASSLVAIGGRVILMRGGLRPGDEPASPAIGPALVLEEQRSFALPGSGDNRALLAFRRIC